MSPNPMVQASLKQPQAHDDAASIGSDASEAVARFLALITGMQADIRARLSRLENLQVKDDQASVVSAGNGIFHTYAEARMRLGRSITLASLEEEVTPNPAQQHGQDIGKG